MSNDQHDRTTPKPDEFQAFLDRAFPEGGSGPGLVYTSYDMEEAFTGGYAAGHAAAVADEYE
jgi:hypothetical protein